MAIDNGEGVHLTGCDMPPSQAQLVSWRWLWTRLLAAPAPEMTMPSELVTPEGTHDDSTFTNQQRRANDASTKEQIDDTAGNLPTSSHAD